MQRARRLQRHLHFTPHSASRTCPDSQFLLHRKTTPPFPGCWRHFSPSTCAGCGRLLLPVIAAETIRGATRSRSAAHARDSLTTATGCFERPSLERRAWVLDSHVRFTRKKRGLQSESTAPGFAPSPISVQHPGPGILPNPVPPPQIQICLDAISVSAPPSDPLLQIHPAAEQTNCDPSPRSAPSRSSESSLTRIVPLPDPPPPRILICGQ